ncbi:GNAT family N-acetyltransferase, partial [Sinorhizobium meliloti]
MIGNVLPADVNGSANRLLGGLAQSGPDTLQSERTLMVGRPGRHLAVYPARAGYDLQRELDFLSNRAIEQNVFFTGRFLAPAMPRLEDRVIRLAVIRDQSEQRSRLRFLMPFSIEKPGFSIGATIIRAWSNPFGPLGTPLLDAEDAAETISNLYE